MTPYALLIFIGGPCLVVLSLYAIDWICHRKVRSIEQDQLAPEAERDQRETHVFYNGNHFTF